MNSVSCYLLMCIAVFQHCGLFLLVVLIEFLWSSMFSKGLGASTSPIVIQSEIKDSPVKAVKANKLRWVLGSQLPTTYRITFE